MQTTTLRVLLLLLALPVLGFHATLKKQPHEADVAQLSGGFTRPGEWRGKVAPDFELALLDGTHFSMSDHVGREVVILNFFTTWCGPCRAEMPELNRFVAARKGQPVTLIGIDGEEKRELVEKFVRELNVAFPIGIDDTGDLQKTFGIESYPVTVVVGADGRIQLYQPSAILNADVALAAIVDQELGRISAGAGVSKEGYLQAVKAEVYPWKAEASGSEARLAGRARQIAETMDCPCGCSDTLVQCSCNTAKKAKAKLSSLPLEGRKDAEVKEELNREFCMKGMQ